tara:strand:+ start:4405 stop:5322 length:918 start_codon:yes stop_codon:yes gene_type:complete
MDDNLADSVVETSESEVEEVFEDQSETEDDSTEVAEEGSEEPDEAEDGEESEQEDDQPEGESVLETVDVEYDGEQYKLPPKLKDAFMREQDYTVKTQTLAAEKHDFQQYMEATQANQQSMANLAAIDQQLQSYQEYDWNSAFDADITSATKLQHQMQQLQSQREQLVGTIQQGEQQRKALRHDNMVKVAQRTDAQLKKEIPNWGEGRKSELGRFAVETMGFPAEMVAQAVTPPEILALHYAEIGYQTVQKVKNAKKPKGSKVVEVKPSKNLKPKKQSAPKSLSNVSDPNAYRELRMAQKRKNMKG